MPDDQNEITESMKARKKVAVDHGLPAALADRLQGETEADLRADAARFARAMKGDLDDPSTPTEGRPVNPELQALALMFAKQATRTRTLLEPSLAEIKTPDSPGVIPPIETVDGPGLKADRRNRPEIDEGD